MVLLLCCVLKGAPDMGCDATAVLVLVHFSIVTAFVLALPWCFGVCARMRVKCADIQLCLKPRCIPLIEQRDRQLGQ